MTSEVRMRDGLWTMRNELTNGSFATDQLKSCPPAHGGHAVWHVFNQSNQWGSQFEYYLRGTGSL